ncbi:hypothetical protein [Diatraea saccharalis granulovirus]|uniref:Uncharacterized protein n=1 Tax=Diatraea saccharalis granulovirus TaxID=1675862 RepID=A0A0R7EYZ7_9BBAC|nr:hypothetical protein [Diatraea saccharalis granulovirus]AKN80781.1 hypothetical protein [Diatraea saccharalis granulovirus]
MLSNFSSNIRSKGLLILILPLLFGWYFTSLSLNFLFNSSYFSSNSSYFSSQFLTFLSKSLIVFLFLSSSSLYSCFFRSTF